jgi:hypothetical protein
VLLRPRPGWSKVGAGPLLTCRCCSRHAPCQCSRQASVPSKSKAHGRLQISQEVWGGDGSDKAGKLGTMTTMWRMAQRAHVLSPPRSKACSGDVPGDGLARGALTSRTPSNACGDVSARQALVSRCVETPARHPRLTTLLVPSPRRGLDVPRRIAKSRHATLCVVTQRLCRWGRPAAPRVADARGFP